MFMNTSSRVLQGGLRGTADGPLHVCSASNCTTATRDNKAATGAHTSGHMGVDGVNRQNVLTTPCVADIPSLYGIEIDNLLQPRPSSAVHSQ
jgi:hypothetical protein